MQWADVLALSGDAADNVPGVAGVGPKTALSLLQRFGDLESVLGSASEVRPQPRPRPCPSALSTRPLTSRASQRSAF